MLSWTFSGVESVVVEHTCCHSLLVVKACLVCCVGPARKVFLILISESEWEGAGRVGVLTRKIFLEENHLFFMLNVGHAWGNVGLHHGFRLTVRHAWGDLGLPHGTGLLGIIVGRISGLRLNSLFFWAFFLMTEEEKVWY